MAPVGLSPLPPGAEQARGSLLLAIGLGALAAILVVGQAWLLSTAIDAAFIRGVGLGGVPLLIASLVGVAVARAAVAWMAETAAQRGANRAKAAFRDRLLDKVVRLGPHGLSRDRTGELANTLGNGVETYDGYVGQYVPQLALAILAPLIVGSAVFRVDPLSALVLGLTFPLIPLFMVLIGGAARQRTRRQWEQLSRMSARFLDAVQGLATLKAFGRSRDESVAIARASETFRVLTMNVLRVAFVSALVLEMLATLGTAIVAVEVGLRLLYGRIAFREALFVLILAPEFYRPLRALGAAFHAGMAGREAVARAGELFARPAAASPATVPATRSLILHEPPALDFDAVSFRYESDRAPALDHVSFHIESGTTTALAGPSGAGKSTVAQLLLRFIEPQAGVVRVDGHPLDSIEVEQWRRHVAWVPQRPHLFHGSVLDNLLVAHPDADRQAIERALALAHADTFVARLPQGLDTPLGEHGARLSGGQSQRLALARAFLRDAPVVILDEPTAQLDPEHEALVLDSMAQLSRGRTVLLIAHRLSTLLGAGRVVMLSAGRVVESGTHVELIAADGEYARLAAAFGRIA